MTSRPRRIKLEIVSCYLFRFRRAQNPPLVRPLVNPARSAIIAIVARRRAALAIRVHCRRAGKNLFAEIAQLAFHASEQRLKVFAGQRLRSEEHTSELQS